VKISAENEPYRKMKKNNRKYYNRILIEEENVKMKKEIESRSLDEKPHSSCGLWLKRS